MIGHVKSYGVEIIREQVMRLNKTEGGFEVTTSQKKYQVKSLILAMGASSQRLNIPGEDKFLGKGVSYCTNCDAPLFKDKIVALVGGGDCAVSGALHLAAFAKKVYLIHRRSEFRAEAAWLERMNQEAKIEKILENQVIEIKGEEKVTAVVLEKPYHNSNILPVSGIFIEIGRVPAGGLVKDLQVKLDGQGYVIVSPATNTNIGGVFAAGDLSVVEGEVFLRQFITSAADGARAAAAVYQYLHKGGPTPSWGK
jgi:thioredoxin reductase (NADPH)